MNSIRNALLNAIPNKSATEPKVNAPKNEEPFERILTVNIKTMRLHLKNESFNNVHTILELFAKVIRILPPEQGKMRVHRLTLGSLENIHRMEAIFFGNANTIQAGDTVRCVGKLNGQTGQFKINKITQINLGDERELIERLEAMSSFQLAK